MLGFPLFQNENTGPICSKLEMWKGKESKVQRMLTLNKSSCYNSETGFKVNGETGCGTGVAWSWTNRLMF